MFHIDDASTKVFGVVKYTVTLIAWANLTGDRHYWVPKNTVKGTDGKEKLLSFVSAPLGVEKPARRRIADEMLEQAGLSWRYHYVHASGSISYHTLTEDGPGGYSQPRVQYVYETVTDSDKRESSTMTTSRTWWRYNLGFTDGSSFRMFR